MKIEVCNSYEEVSRKAKNIILDKLGQARGLKLCAATGGSPTGLYKELGGEYDRNPDLFSKLHIIKLDEWGAIAMDNKGTCETYLQTHVIRPLSIPANRYLSFFSNPDNPENECDRVQCELDKMGGIDICIVGLGMNGHLALNEPADCLLPHCHLAQLSPQSLNHPMLCDDEKPKYGLTLGMGNILQSQMIILLINGENKKEIANQLLSSKEISTRLPASFLWLHPNVICLIDKKAASCL